MNEERISSGIPGLDKLIEGGFVKGTTILVSGFAGTGKTIFCCQFIWEGLKKGENCMFISFEESSQDIKKDAMIFGWNFDKYEKEKRLIMKYKPPLSAEDLFFFEDEIKRKGISRIALDSISILSMAANNIFEARKYLFRIISMLKESGATSILTAETTNPEIGSITRFGIEEFIVDGIITLHILGMGGGSYRSLRIIKMRRTKHSQDIYPIEITSNGIVVKY